MGRSCIVLVIRSLRHSLISCQPVPFNSHRLLCTLSSSSFLSHPLTARSAPSSRHFSTGQIPLVGSKNGSTPSSMPSATQPSPSTSTDTTTPSEVKPDKPMTTWEKFKDMYKKYWYVLVPVHGILCVLFMVALYYMVKSGVDVVSFLEKLGLPERFIAPLRKSGATAYIAAAYAVYHLISPIRYAVTLGATTLTITYLKRLGYIKPVPSRARINQFVTDKRESASQKVRVFSNRLKNKPRENGKRNGTK